MRSEDFLRRLLQIGDAVPVVFVGVAIAGFTAPRNWRSLLSVLQGAGLTMRVIAMILWDFDGRIALRRRRPPGKRPRIVAGVLKCWNLFGSGFLCPRGATSGLLWNAIDLKLRVRSLGRRRDVLVAATHRASRSSKKPRIILMVIKWFPLADTTSIVQRDG